MQVKPYFCFINYQYKMAQPLAERMRPRSLKDYVGQQHLLGKKGALAKQIKEKAISSMILWGPPGCGKTTLAHLIAKEIDRAFYAISAVDASVKQLREIIASANKNNLFQPESAPILFIDEIHRFNKAQQDALLHAVEKGQIILIGATTENPSFEVNSALLSRAQVYILHALKEEDLEKILLHAIKKDEGLKKKTFEIKQTQSLFSLAMNDARKLLNIIDLLAQTSLKKVLIDNTNVESIVGQNLPAYDKNSDQHYNIISAFIKSIRGSDPNASLYWLARMIQAGEDPKFIARRLIILASEDIGLANPTALVIANNCFRAIEVIGMPEGRIILSQTVLYLATSAKSNSAYQAINTAMDLAKKYPNKPVPLHLRNAPTKLMKNLGYAQNYKYAHAYSNHHVDQEFFPDALSKTQIYTPSDNQRENQIKEYLRLCWNNRYEY